MISDEATRQYVMERVYVAYHTLLDYYTSVSFLVIVVLMLECLALSLQMQLQVKDRHALVAIGIFWLCFNAGYALYVFLIVKVTTLNIIVGPLVKRR